MTRKEKLSYVASRTKGVIKFDRIELDENNDDLKLYFNDDAPLEVCTGNLEFFVLIDALELDFFTENNKLVIF